MCSAEWSIKALFPERPGRRGIAVRSLAGWLLIVAVIAKVFLGCATNLRQAATPLGTEFYKISERFSSDSEPFEKITLPSCSEKSFAFLEKNLSSDNPGSDTQRSVHDMSTLASIGKMSSEATAAPTKKPPPPSRSTLLSPVIKRAAAQYHVDPALVHAIIFAESGYNPTAVSKRGAMGLMQLMPGTAKAMGVKNCFDPEHNIYGGVKYFKKLFNQFDGDVKLALAAYNAGSRKVRQFNGVPPFRATENYIQKVLKYYKIYKEQQMEPVGLG